MVWTEWIGYVAAFFTTASFVPQAWLTFKTRQVSGISLGMYSAFTLGVALWLVYGVLIQAWPVVIANLITLCLAASILWMRWRFGARSSSGPSAPGGAVHAAAKDVIDQQHIALRGEVQVVGKHEGGEAGV